MSLMDKIQVCKNCQQLLSNHATDADPANLHQFLKELQGD